ncbi:phage baseplate protein [Bacillus sp. SD088]|uniref:phage baseplate protein n=1 Tax=Bacillus sp. SD088 TaxID=2782012 RepID=UPI001A9717B3|nr:hypothetical protein [Bacillus sp. SD088]MBO0995020.1 Tat pathway signal sequence domain protein [Bacillus sp. SD088]
MNIIFLKNLFLVLLGLLVYLFQPTQVQAKIPLTQPFDVKGQALEIFREKPLQNSTVLQGIGFDDRHQHIYTVQVMEKGYRFPDEKTAVRGAERASNGDLVLTKLDIKGHKLGHMYLRGFGHGVSIGVEPSNDEVYIWTETDAVAGTGKNGWGTRIARFPFRDGKTINPNASILEKFDFLPNIDHTTVDIDHAHQLLTMRYRQNGKFYFALYQLADVKQHRFQPIAKMAQPKLGTFQGFASYGNYLYLLEGNDYGTRDSQKPNGNTHITTMDWKTREIVDKQWIGIANNLPFREPEGMGIYLPRDQDPDQVLLCIGFASTITKNNPDKLASIYGFPLKP